MKKKKKKKDWKATKNWLSMLRQKAIEPSLASFWQKDRDRVDFGSSSFSFLQNNATSSLVQLTLSRNPTLLNKNLQLKSLRDFRKWKRWSEKN